MSRTLFLTLASPYNTLVLLGALSVVTVFPLAVFWVSFGALLGSLAVPERLFSFGKLGGATPRARSYVDGCC